MPWFTLYISAILLRLQNSLNHYTMAALYIGREIMLKQLHNELSPSMGR